MSHSKKRFIILLADGARHDVFQELLEMGRLPHLEEAFLREGTFAKATSVFPSTTGPAYMPFLTGCFPGTCNVPGIRWFNKEVYAKKKISLERFRSYVGFESFLMNRDMDPKLKTLFQHFPKSYNIFSSVNRGVPKQGNISAHMRLWYWYYAHLTDRWHLVDEAALEKTLSVLKQDFEFLFVVFPGIDEYSHLSQPRHPHAIEAYQSIDRAIGKIVKELKAQGKLEETAYFIVSDHGLSETKTHFGVASFLESHGIKTFYYPKIFKRGFQAASMVSGNAMLHLYFKSKSGWAGRMSFEEIQEAHSQIFKELFENPAVDLLISQDREGWFRVLSRKGEVKIKEEGREIIFANLQGNPLGLPETGGRFSRRQVLDLTAESSYPDSLMQVCQLFRSPRSGDLILSAAKGYDLRKRFEHPEHKSSHGAMHDEHMLIPLFSSVKMRRSFVRSADLFPSLMGLHGDPVPLDIDGESFF
jgi:type I phosphodiesterase/nucleotide pyrophosphatase